MSTVDELNNARRLEELDRYDVLDTSSEEAFDRVTRLVCRLFEVSMSTVTFIDGHRQWFKSRQGVASPETARDFSLCQVPTAEGSPLIVENTLDDDRFRDNPLVCGAPDLRFYAGVPIRSAQGLVIGTLCAMDTRPRSFSAEDLDLLVDMAKLVETELELRIQAATDSLTGALSRRAFFAEAERAIALAQRQRYDLSCIVFDIDHFKAVNDSYGHAVGDAVLRQTVQASRDQLRKSDVLGRIGGEEFALILPHTLPSDALKVAEKIRAAIASKPLKRQGGKIHVTASFGIASLDASQADVHLLVERADVAMYSAKAAGRNRSMLWQSEQAEPFGLARRVLKAGQIVFNRGNSVIDCTVKRLSGLGARLDVVASAGVPQRFKLSIAADAFSRICMVVERQERHIEVVFEG